jgi:hypothetical protein
MSFDAQKIYELLPAIYRTRDAQSGEPLKALLGVIADQVGVLNENLAQLYDDQFIETCNGWVVPYIGDLIGYRTLHNVIPKIGSQRAEVAHTIGFRRRKGTAAMLEQLARDVTGWNARAVEFFEQLGWTQWTPNHIRQNNFYAPDLRQWEPLEKINGPFDSVAHTIDVRSVTNGQGKYNIQNIGIFLWRLGAYSLTDSPAFKLNAKQFLFHPLGYDSQLFTNPVTEDEVTHLAEPINVPNPISRRMLQNYFSNYYGSGKSIFLKDADASKIIICDLTDWIYKPAAGKIAIDPVLGRIAFGSAQTKRPLVTFYYGFGDDMGGGEYERAATFDALLLPVEKVPAPNLKIQDALNKVKNGGVVEISDSGFYKETPTIKVNAGQRIELRAANEHRPTLGLGGNLKIHGAENSEVTLNGLLISGGAIHVTGKLQKLRLIHCTLVPSNNPSLVVDLPDVTIEIDHCIVGTLRIHERSSISISDSIVDATDENVVAFAAANEIDAGGTLQIADTTFVGTIHTLELQLASNSIFMSDVHSEKRQDGCVRFCYLPLTSIVPRRYRCQPEDDENILRVKPQFTSLRYGDPGYGQLAARAATEIREGADDEAEMGAFHELFEPQRETNLRVRLDEYLRFGLEAGIFYVT